MALTSAPTLIAEVGFASDPMTPAAGVAWTDVTTYVMGFHTKMGRQHETGRVEAATCDLILDNNDRRFDPTNTSSPYWPNVVPMRRLRIRATWNAITYSIFNGFVENWPVKWPEVTESHVALTAVDGLKNANLKKLLTPYAIEVLKDSPAGYWRMQETSTQQAAADTSGKSWAGKQWVGAPVFGVAGMINDGTSGAVRFVDATGDYLDLGFDPAITGTQSFSIEAQYVATPGSGVIVLVQQGVAGDILLSVGSDGSISFRAGGGLVYISTYPFTLNDNQMHHVVATRDGSTGELSIYVDKVLRKQATPAAAVSIPSGRVYVGRDPSYYLGQVAADCTIDEVAIYPGTVLSSTRVAAHYDARTSWLNQLTGTRVGAVLDALGWPAADRAIEAGISTMPAVPQPGTALQELTDAAVAENGLFFQGPDGKMTFFQRSHLATNAASNTSQATFGDGPGQLPYVLPGIEPTMDDLDIYNQVLVNRAGGPQQRAFDASSDARYGSRVLSETDIKITSDLEALDRANYKLARYKSPTTRVRAFTVTGASDPANLFPQMLGRSLWDRVTFRRQPPGGGAAFQQDSCIEGIEHDYKMVGDWRTTFRLSPADTAAYLILDDATYGRLDYNQLAY